MPAGRSARSADRSVVAVHRGPNEFPLITALGRSAISLGVLVLISMSAIAQSIFTIAGGGTDDGRPATFTPLSPTTGIAVDSAGNLAIAQGGDARVRIVHSATGLLDTVAGTGIDRFSGDGGPAPRAELQSPAGIAVDGAGNLYIPGGNRVRKVSAATGAISTVAGTETSGFSGDQGPATAAKLKTPRAVTSDSAGNLYISDSGNARIRRVDAASGIIDTVAGNGAKGSAGDGGPATQASIDSPPALAIHPSGDLLFVEPDGNRVRSVNLATRVIATLAGTGAPGFGGDGGAAASAILKNPRGVDVDSNGNSFIADAGNFRVRRIDAMSGAITTIAGNGTSAFSGDGGPATQAGIGSPASLDLDAAGNLFIESSDHQRVRKVNLATGIITTVAGNGESLFAGDGRPATAAGLARPAGVLVDRAGNLYVSSWSLGVRKIDGDTGIITTIAGNGKPQFSGDGGPATAAGLSSPDGLAIDSRGNLYIADTNHLRVRRIDAATGIITTVAGDGTTGFGDLFEDGGPAREAGLRPVGIAIDDEDNLFICDLENKGIRKVDAQTGIIDTVAGGSLNFGGDQSDGIPAARAWLVWPSGITIDSRGNLYIVDEIDARIRKVDAASGKITTVAGRSFEYGDTGDGGPGTLALVTLPRGVSVNERGDVYISDTFNYRLRKVDASTGIITTVGGTGLPDFTGDGGRAIDVSLELVTGITLDREGTVFVSDESNDRVRRISACIEVGPPSLTSPSNGSSGVVSAPSLTWSPVTGAFRYDVYLDVSPSLQTLAATDITATSFSPSNLESLTTYYWRVIAKGDPFCTPPSKASSEIRSFTTAGGCRKPAGFEGEAP